MKHTIVQILLMILPAGSALAATGAEQYPIRVRGEIISMMLIDVKPEAGGRVKKLHVHMGDRVKAGDLLAEIETENPDNDPSKTKVRAVKDGMVVSLPATERQTVVAPGIYDNTANNGTTLMTIAEVSKLCVLTHIKESDAAKLAVGQVGQVTTESVPNGNMEAVIDIIPPHATIRNSVRGFTVRAVIEKPDPRLKPGMTCELTFATSTNRSK